MTINNSTCDIIKHLIAMFFAIMVFAATTEAQDWTELGPAPIVNGHYSGRVSAVVCSPTDPNRYFIAGADGGVWRTTNGGTTWVPLTDHMPTTAMGALALDPSDENIIYAGTGEPNYANHSRYGLGLYKSTDGGDTWVHLAQELFSGRCFSGIIVHPDNSNIIYSSITRAGGFPELAAAKGHPDATGAVGVFRSDDGGVTWVHLAGLPNLSATDLAMDPVDSNTLYAGIGRIFGHVNNGIYKTIDGGASWIKLTSGLPQNDVGRISVAVSPSNPNRLYSMFTEGDNGNGRSSPMIGAFRSDDAGQTWTQINLGNIQATYGYYLSVISVDPFNENTAIFGGLNLVRTTNAGASFSTITPPHVDMHALAWDESGRLVAGDDGGVHRSPDIGNSWSSLNNGLGLIQLYAGLSTHPADERIVFGGMQDNGSNRRNTNSRQWTQVFGGDGGWTQLDQNNANIVFIEYQGTGNLFRSTNGGNNFGGSASGINGGDRNCFLPPFLINPLDSSRMLYATHRIYRSTNGGTSWSAISGDLTDGGGAIRAIAQSTVDPNVVYASTNDGNVLVSQDEGASWQLIANNHPGWPRVTRELHVRETESLTLYLCTAVFGTDQIKRTINGGQTWQVMDGDLPDIPVNVVVENINGPQIIFAGTDSGVYFSDNDGTNWQQYGDGIPNAVVIDLVIDNQFNRIVASTQGRGVWSAPIYPQAAVLSDFNIVVGTHLDGGLEEIERSDDAWLHTQSGFGSTLDELHQMTMVVGATSPLDSATTIEIVIESRIDDPSGTAKITLHNWNTGEMDQVGKFSIGETDETVNIEGIAAKAYIRDSDNRIEMQVKHIVFAPFMSFRFESFLDQVKLLIR